VRYEFSACGDVDTVHVAVTNRWCSACEENLHQWRGVEEFRMEVEERKGKEEGRKRQKQSSNKQRNKKDNIKTEQIKTI
jgi:hypothetical protein